jgi:multicomponent Na+:H+ antiporter subunit G
MLEVISYIFITIGIIMIVTAVVGCNRLPDYFCKMHAATVGDAVGCPLILIGIALQSEHSLKIILLSIIILIVNPAGSYILNRFALNEKDEIDDVRN